MHWLRVLDRGGVERNLVGSAFQHGLDVIDGAQAAADGERHEALFGGGSDDVVHDLATVARSGDVEENEFVGTLGIIGLGALDRIAGIAELLKFHTFDDATIGHIEARNDSSAEHDSVCLCFVASVINLIVETRKGGIVWRN
jgi:hypothetical protein